MKCYSQRHSVCMCHCEVTVGGGTVSNGFLNMDDSSLWKPLFAILLALNNSPVKLEARKEQLYYPTFGCAAPGYHNIIL